jgi:hypothetical protein
MNQDQARTETPTNTPRSKERRGPLVAGTAKKGVPSLRPTLQDPTTCQAPTTPHATHGPRPPNPKKGQAGLYW